MAWFPLKWCPPSLNQCVVHHLHGQEEPGHDVHLERSDQAVGILKRVSAWIFLAVGSSRLDLPRSPHLVERPEGRGEDKVIDVLDTGDGDTGDDTQELPWEKEDSESAGDHDADDGDVDHVGEQSQDDCDEA